MAPVITARPMPRTQPEPQGKAWWVQLQHDRAVTAGCQFYTYRPATSGSGNSLPQQARNFALRPSTVDTSPTTNAARDVRLQSPCTMRPETSPKLPARKSLGSRQGSGVAALSTAGSRPVPSSRGNDWSPVHSRPVTRSTAHARVRNSMVAATSRQLPASAAGSQAPAVAGMCGRPATHHGRKKPPVPRSKQQRPFTTPFSPRPPLSHWRVSSALSILKLYNLACM